MQHEDAAGRNTEREHIVAGTVEPVSAEETRPSPAPGLHTTDHFLKAILNAKVPPHLLASLLSRGFEEGVCSTHCGHSGSAIGACMVQSHLE